MNEYVCVVTPNLTFRPVDFVVRCRDCKFYYGGECTLLDFSLRDMEDGYCAWSEPREEN